MKDWRQVRTELVGERRSIIFTNDTSLIEHSFEAVLVCSAVWARDFASCAVKSKGGT
jgi:hypothetical protein